MLELTEEACKNWRYNWLIIKPEVDVIRNKTDRTIDNQVNINLLQNFRCHGHSLSSCMFLKLRIDGKSMQEFGQLFNRKLA